MNAATKVAVAIALAATVCSVEAYHSASKREEEARQWEEAVAFEAQVWAEKLQARYDEECAGGGKFQDFDKEAFIREMAQGGFDGGTQ